VKLAVGEDKTLQDELMRQGEIPGHIAIIMDGNGRWARRRGLPRIAGHQAGVESVRDIVETCGQLGVSALTLFAFSTENWRRPKEEVSLLMRLLLRYLHDEIEELGENNVRLTAIGQLESLPNEVQNQLFETVGALSGNTGLNLNLALSYSGRWDLTRGIQQLAADVRSGALEPSAIDESVIRRYLSTASLADPDLLIRTSGEMRLSNFMLWELAYSELHVTPVYWPDFRRGDLYAAIREYHCRERRFGMTSEQVRKRKPTVVRRLLNAIVG
jgi:undecaprenyl diphosphate synthase